MLIRKVSVIEYCRAEVKSMSSHSEPAEGSNEIYVVVASSVAHACISSSNQNRQMIAPQYTPMKGSHPHANVVKGFALDQLPP